jgi:nicotinamide riboside transporter PnuC
MLWSWVLSIIGITGLWFVGKKRWWGWAIAFTNECLWIIYALTTGQYGFILGALAYMTIHIINTHRWLKDDNE